MTAPGPRIQTVQTVGDCELPTAWAVFRLHGFAEVDTGIEHVALTLGDVADGKPVLARIHSECLTGDALFSRRCDCGAQLEAAMRRIAAEGRGVLLYLRQEGRGIGLLNKIRAYQLQDRGADTVEANESLGFPADPRRYDVCRPILESLGIGDLQLMTNNPRKLRALNELGIRIAERIPLVVGETEENRRYLATKQAKLAHWLERFEDELSDG